MKLLIITQKVDSEDQLLGFFINWIKILANGFESIVVLCLAQDKFSLPENVRVISLGKDRGESKAHQLFNFYKYTWLLRKDYDAVFVHMNPIWVVLGGFWWHRLSKKVFFWYTHKAVTFKLKLAEKFADVIFTASKESFRLPSRKVIVTGHGIDTELFKPDPNKLQATGDKLKILSVGRIAPVKNYEIFIEAAKILKDKGFNFLVTVIGEAPLEKDKNYEESLKFKVKSLNLEDNFNFIGKVNYENLPVYYQSHDLFIHLSKTGSLDKALLEAMACGLKVLSSNEASRAFLPPDLNFQDNDPQELADKIVVISTKRANPNLRNYVIEKHNLSILIEKISSFISKKNRVLIVGYTYADENCLKTFNFYPDVASVYFLIPNYWPIKGGKFVYRPLEKKNVQTAKAFFYHSNYPLIGGALKGWIPAYPFVLAQKKPDIVFSASDLNLLTTLYQGFFAKLANAKHIIFTWENIPYEKKFKGFKYIIQKAIITLNLLFCDGLICGSARSEAIMKTLTNKPIAIIPQTGVDVNFFSSDHSKKIFQNKDYTHDIVFCFVGAIGYRKGIHLIINAFKEVSKLIANCRLIIAGSGEYEQEIEKMIEELKLGDSIIRIPWLNKDGVRDLLNSSDVFLYPSISYKGWEEQFGYSLAEASSMELPVITTESGSISEVVLNEKTGFLIKPDNCLVLKEAMIILAANKQKRLSMGKAGRQFICDNYSYQIVARKFNNFFDSF